MGSVHRYYLGWFLGCLMVILAPPVHAADPAQRYGCEHPIRLAWIPNAIVYRDGRGFDPDLVAELQRRSGCRIEAQAVPREEVWIRLADGRLDLLPSGLANAERLGFSFFVPTLYYRIKLIVRADLAPKINSFPDFQNLPDVRLGVVRGYWRGPYYENGVRTLDSLGRVSSYATDAERFDALLRDEVQAVIAHDINLEQAVAPDRRLEFRVLDLNPGPSLVAGLMLSRRNFSAAQAAEWLRLMESMRLDGSLAQLVRSNMPVHLEQEFLNSGYRYEVSRRSSAQ